MKPIRLNTGEEIKDRAFFRKYTDALRLYSEQPYAQELLASLDALVSGRVHNVVLKMKGGVQLPILKEYKSAEFKKLFKAAIYQIAGFYMFQEPAPICLLSDSEEFLAQDADELTGILSELGKTNFELLKKLKDGVLKANDLHILGKLGMTNEKNKLLEEVAKFVSVQLLIESDDFTILPTIRPITN